MVQSEYDQMKKCVERTNDKLYRSHEIRNERINFIVIFLIVYIQYSLWFLEYSASIRMALTLGLIGVLLTFHNFKLRINVYSLIVFVVGILCIIISCLVNGFNLQFDGWNVVTWSCAFLTSSIIGSSSFYKAYTKTIAILAFSGTVVFCISLFIPSIFFHLPILDKQSWTSDAIIHNAFLGTVSLYSNYKRNFGIFYEPGLFAFHLNLAVFLELFVLERPNTKHLMILLAALLSTFSTNGFITVSIFFIAYFLKKHNQLNRTQIKKIKGICGVIVIIAIFIFVTNNSIWLFLINKLSELNSSSTAGSGFERFRAFKYATETFLENPVFGVGQEGWITIFNGYIATFTPINWFALYGIIYGLLCIILYVRIITVGKSNVVSMAIQFVGLLTLIVSQNVSNYFVIIIIILYNASTFTRKI
ncbi:O-antigen ligase family protein [Clostridium magnum]|uniref:O-antigen ligase-related domain-containing protein n=1 Tax=Clostridium magnum DSM 2767 TaxID=1121326 RepID=A0A161WDF6_9CLOT|nr:O-antigen ligase family protein [Clostridium magnum]KZL89725.1 hypothetical protein CLMAG_47230 [Clostridium magnum DSM 2767]SHH64984.1 hypothetical protein SAMN02745944_01095 [Clostridium magnum DSM 2767]